MNDEGSALMVVLIAVAEMDVLRAPDDFALRKDWDEAMTCVQRILDEEDTMVNFA